MDLLGGYGSDSDDEDQPAQQRRDPSASTVAATASVSTAAAVPAAKAAPAVLFNPFAEDAPGQPARMAVQQLAGGAKRPFTSVTGHSLPVAAGTTAKASKQASAARPAAKPATLLPPQLRGRSNVVTEDIDKLFVKRPPGSSTAAAAAAAAAPGPAAFGPAAKPAPP